MPRRKVNPDESLTDNAEEKSPPQRATPKGPSKKKDIAAFVGALNEVLAAFPASREDALTEPEAAILVEGIDRAQQQSPPMQKFFKSAGRASGWLALAYAATIIGLPRLARHNLIPAGVGERLRGLLARDGEMPAPAEPPPAPSPAVAGRPTIPPVYAPGDGSVPAAVELVEV